MRTVRVAPWADPVVERCGHRFDSLYVRRFYTPILGPSALLLHERLAELADRGPVSADIDQLAACVGITKANRVDATVRRLYRFGLARVAHNDTIEVRCHLADLPARWVAGLPATLRSDHQQALIARRRMTAVSA